MLELGTRYANKRSFGNYGQESRHLTGIFICRHVGCTGRCSYSCISSDSRDRVGGRGRQPAHHVPLVLLLLLSPFPLPHILFFPLVSPSFTPTQEMCCLLLHKLHVFFSACKYTSKVHYRNCAYLHAVQHTADGFVMPAKAYQSDTDVPVPPSTTVNYNPNPEPTRGDVAPSMDTNQPHPPPPAFFAGCCLVILPWQSPCISQPFPPRGRL